ncbi:MAG: 2,5-diamino-6-(ribosylamino)-4(3H)-pyrimidinone 5'-phosphate reductase [Methanoregula sp.]|nr:MAG: 2,5-diamino-6-(ribosylamino)-4(3H)-pyrimidinone 5'-phosphate reductase [Methanoregula sp.]
MRPHVVVNVAMSADGKISTRERRQVKISGAEDFIRVDGLKAESDAVMVGIGTVLADDPSLTVKSDDLKKKRKEQGKDEHPVRVVIDSFARIPLDASVLRKGDGMRVVAVSQQADPVKVAMLGKLSKVVVAGKDEVDLESVLEELALMGVRRLMVEGGGTLIAGLFAKGLVDELYTFVGNIIISGKDAPTLSDGNGFIGEADFPRLTLCNICQTGDGVLLHWNVRRGK